MNHYSLRYCLLLIASMVWFSSAHAQLNLDTCVAQARANFPAIQQLNLIQQSEELALSNANKNYLPQLSVNAQATHQSDVTQLPVAIPNLDVPTVSKNQYRVYGELVQPLSDLLVIKHHKDLINTEKEVRTHQLNVALRQVNLQVNRLYFSVLMLDAQLHRVSTVMHDLEAGLEVIKAAVKEGVSYPADYYTLQVELLRVNQHKSELAFEKEAALKLLSQFIGQPIDANVTLEFPAPDKVATENLRPELSVLAAQKKQLIYETKLIEASTLPKVFLFGQSGYGRPALNMLNNELDFYYITGVKMNWNISTFYTSSNKKELIAFKEKQLDIEKETFLFNHSAEATRIINAIDRIDAMLHDDEQIILLHTKIVAASKSQLQHGTITSTEYIHRINAANRAKVNLETHKIRRLLHQYEYYNLLNP